MKTIVTFILSLFAYSAMAQVGIYPNAENLRSDTIDVLDYEIHLDISDYSGKTLSGYTTVSCRAKMDNINTLDLDLLKFNVDSIVLNNVVLSYSYNDTLLHIDLGSTYNTGDLLNVSVYYHGTTQKDPSGWGGIYFGNNYAFNMGVGFHDKPHNIGRYWFPCFDNFKERSTYNLFLTTLDDQYATSIGALISSTPKANNKIEWYWKLDETIPTYLAMFAVNYYTTVNDSFIGMDRNIPITLFAKSSDTTNLKGSFANLKNAMTAFEGLYGPYPFNKIGYTVVNFSSGAMEHASNITYPNNVVNGNLGSETLMAHELAHQWWGNYATTLTPEDMWLNEGMASFSANYFLEAVYGWETSKDAVKTTLFNILKKAHINEGGYLAISGVPHELTYGDHVYRKGSLVAQNLRMLLGENDFGPAITGFLQSKAFDNMTSLQFRDYLQNTSSADVVGFFDGWVFNGGFPDYKIDSYVFTPTPALDDLEIIITQTLNHAPNQFSEIPIEIAIYDDQFNVEIKSVMVGPGTNTVNVNTFLNPTFVTLNPNNKLCYATTDDAKVIKRTGINDFPNAMMRLDVQSVSDSALVKIEHHWSAPDPIKDWANQPYRLSNYRYWKVDGLFPSGFETAADLMYDGREGSGYLDSLLVNVTEDSLILMYRASALDDWAEYTHYTKNTLGSSTDGFGRILISKLIKGEYTLANVDHSVLTTGKLVLPDTGLKVYPNPSRDQVTIEWTSSQVPKSIEIYALDGKRILSLIPTQNNRVSLNVKTMGNGSYIAKVIFDEEAISKQFSVLY